MGMYSSLVFVMEKEAYFKEAVMLNKLPKLMGEMYKVEPKTEKEKKEQHFFYWTLEYFKWYLDDPLVTEFIKYIEELPDDVYGAIVIHEDETKDIWGNPFDFDLQVELSIKIPINDFTVSV